MTGEIAAEEGMKVGTDITETGPVAIMAEDKGQKAGAEDTMMTREGTMLVGTAAETTEISSRDRYERRDSRDRKEYNRDRRDYSTDRRNRSRGRHDRSQSRGRQDRSQSRGRNNNDRDVKCFQVW